VRFGFPSSSSSLPLRRIDAEATPHAAVAQVVAVAGDLKPGHRGARIKSELDTGHVAETASQIAERGASHPIGRRGASLPSINDYDLTTRRMDVDAPRPRCPFCGRPMQFRLNELSTLQTFDCNGCQVLLNVPSQAGVPGIAVPVLARD
jgi:hypothetical protein